MEHVEEEALLPRAAQPGQRAAVDDGPVEEDGEGLPHGRGARPGQADVDDLEGVLLLLLRAGGSPVGEVGGGRCFGGGHDPGCGSVVVGV